MSDNNLWIISKSQAHMERSLYLRKKVFLISISNILLSQTKQAVTRRDRRTVQSFMSLLLSTFITINVQRLHEISMLHRQNHKLPAQSCDPASRKQNLPGVVIQHRQKQNLPNTTCERCRSFEANPKLPCTYHNAYANASWNCDAATQEPTASSQNCCLR